MKNILVPTDFSDFAEHAMETAATIARKTGAKLHLLHHAQIPAQWGELTDIARDLYPQSKQIVEDIGHQFERLEADERFSDLDIATIFTSGNLPDRVSEYIDAMQIDLVVMGSHGASGFKEMVIGSNTQKVVRYAHCPVLTVRDKSLAAFRNIVFVSSFEDAVVPGFKAVVEFGNLFDAHFHLLFMPHPNIVGIATEGEEDRSAHFIALCPPNKVTRHVYPSTSIEGTIKEFLKGLDADLVASAHYGSEPLLRMFRYSLTESLINHLDIPVLSVSARR